jgi:hypothetical protein
LPGRPFPDFSEPASFDDVQDNEMLDVVSVSVVGPAFPVIAPPGETVQVAAAAARADGADRPMLRATAPAENRAVAMRLPM